MNINDMIDFLTEQAAMALDAYKRFNAEGRSVLAEAFWRNAVRDIETVKNLRKERDGADK